MTAHDKNLYRALAILGTRPDSSQIKCYGNYISVAGQNLHRQDEDDIAVLKILMADDEFGFAVTDFEYASLELREMQQVWNVIEDNIEKEAKEIEAQR